MSEPRKPALTIASPKTPARIVSLGDLVAELTARRRALGLSQAELALRLGTTQSAVSEWETGQAKPSGMSLFAIADVLGCDIALVPRGDR